jgi:hypothetical protein
MKFIRNEDYSPLGSEYVNLSIGDYEAGDLHSGVHGCSPKSYYVKLSTVLAVHFAVRSSPFALQNLHSSQIFQNSASFNKPGAVWRVVCMCKVSEPLNNILCGSYF